MNEHLNERFGRSRKGERATQGTVEVTLQPPRLNPHIREYFQAPRYEDTDKLWQNRPEIPTSAETLDTESSDAQNDTIEIVPNKPDGPWECKDAYLSAMYELLREDAISSLRDAVAQVRAAPKANEDYEAFGGNIAIYSKVHVHGLTCSPRGIAIKITFSLARTGKKILWEQSKRLTAGSLVVLTPATDAFKTRAMVATVAARPFKGLELNPPEIDLFVARSEELEIDPSIEWLMIEERTGFYEAHRHTMLALQRMMREPFPLSEHLVDAQVEVAAPNYLQQQPRMDLTSVLRNNKHESYENVDVVARWPRSPTSDLDASQLAALQRIITKRLAIVQGPPGTGKTHVSVNAIKIMLANRKPDDPPIIIACQTNHAVDQILRHTGQFEPDFVRLGGQSKDKEIKQRTLYEIRMANPEPPIPGSLAQQASKKMKQLEREIAMTLLPLKPGQTPLDLRMLQDYKILTARQADSLEAGASQWVQVKQGNPTEAQRSPFTVWLGRALVTVPPRQLPEEFGFDFEEVDLGFEQLRESEAENVTREETERLEALGADPLILADNFTCRSIPGITPDRVQKALKEQDLWRIPESMRGAVYRHLQDQAKKHIIEAVRKQAKVYDEQAANRKIGLLELNEPILKKQKIIGMTTTGLSKYRGLLASLQPKVVLIEEAAETLEPPVTAACMPSLQHLILVGDHKQLRPQCHVKAHENAPFYFNISLFERCVNNDIEFTTLSKQRRMIPEVRRLLAPIYGDLITDHPSMLDPGKRPDVPGMGGVNSFFFSHDRAEQRDDLMSVYNTGEAEMIVGFVEYLVYNGTEMNDITVLTFYNGQRKHILSKLRKTDSLAGRMFNVVTVDSYQGEENKVVILSLVRSNDHGQIGFLSVENRACVALSRAQHGFYIFGDGPLLHGNKKSIWRKVIDIMAGQTKKGIPELPKNEPMNRVDEALPLRCNNHNAETLIKDPTEWANINGGCRKTCAAQLDCGHICEYKCHPFPHDVIICHQRCGKTLACGHGQCIEPCSQHTCRCRVCAKTRGQIEYQQLYSKDIKAKPDSVNGKENKTHVSVANDWTGFARVESMRYPMMEMSTSMPSSQRTSPSKGSQEGHLVDIAERLTLNDGNSLSSRSMSSSPSKPARSANGTVRHAWKDTYSVPGAGSPAKRKDFSREKSLLD